MFSADQAIDATLSTIQHALDAASVPHVVQIQQAELPVVTVSPEQWDAALAALTTTEGGVLYALDGAAAKPMSRLQFSTNRSSLRVFIPWATPEGQYLAGPDVGITLGLVSAAIRHNPPPEIDLVFTWVDGSEPAWQARKAAREAECGDSPPLHAMASNDARYISFDELKYALRAVEMFAPWYHRIHLVTDQQVPAWLAREHPRLAVVDHCEIFDDPSALPTFNSHAIESRLHHIPGLTEHYVYFNDDVFLGRYTPPSAFFNEAGHPRVFLAAEKIPEGAAELDDAPVVAAAKNNRTLLEELTGGALHHKLKHVPHPQLRSVGFELESRAKDAFAHTSHSPFRTPTDLSVASSLLPHYALATERGSLGSIRHFYTDVASPEIRWRLPQLLEYRDAEIICLNATTSAPAKNTASLVRFLESYYPLSSTFEVQPS